MKTIMRTILGLTLAAIIAAGYVLSTGVYNMAATEKHWLITEKLIEWMRVNSIAVRAEALQVPDLDKTEYLTIGATHYDAMCTDCHLAPGMEPTELAQGLYPQAPVFAQRKSLYDTEAVEEQAKAYFWVIKNGIKMTAMPAWGLTHDDETIWAMAFFVQQLGGMSAEKYRDLTDVHEDNNEQNDHAHEHAHEHAHDHQHSHHDHPHEQDTHHHDNSHHHDAETD